MLHHLLPAFLYLLAGRSNEMLERNTTDSLSNRILIISAFDVSALHARHTKKELFAELTDSLKNYLAQDIKQDSTMEVIIVPDIIRGDTDSQVLSLMEEKKASKAILIRSLDAYFNEGGERQEEGYGDEKNKIVTSYDLCSNVGYSIYSRSAKLKPSDILVCEYFTSRSVNDSHIIIKFGPDIVGKKKHTFGSVKKNALKYLDEIEYELKTAN